MKKNNNHPSFAESARKVLALLAVTKQIKENSQSYESKKFALTLQAERYGMELSENIIDGLLEAEPMTPQQFSEAIKNPEFGKKKLSFGSVSTSLLLLLLAPDPLKVHVLETMISKFEDLSPSIVTGIYMMFYPLMLYINPKTIMLPIVKNMISFAAAQYNHRLTTTEFNLALLSVYMSAEEFLSANILDQVFEQHLEKAVDYFDVSPPPLKNAVDYFDASSISYHAMLYAPMALGILAYRHKDQLSKGISAFFSKTNENEQKSKSSELAYGQLGNVR